MVSPVDELTNNEITLLELKFSGARRGRGTQERDHSLGTEGEWVRVLCGYRRMVKLSDDLTKNEITLLELKVSEAGRGRGQYDGQPS